MNKIYVVWNKQEMSFSVHSSEESAQKEWSEATAFDPFLDIEVVEIEGIYGDIDVLKMETLSQL